jgi:protein TonB
LPAYRLTSPYERPPLRRRASGFALALGLNLLLLFLLLGLGVRLHPPKKGSGALVVVDLVPQPENSETKAEPSKPVAQPRKRPVPKPPPIVLPVKPTITVEKPLPMIELTHEDYAAADVRALPKSAAASASADDSQAVGRGPNGEVLYAAEWAREPTNQELSFYLPRNAPDGYGLIACKTYPRNRVDDCVALESHPASSHLAGAVLNAAWQFKVRPPRKNGKPMIGEWVRIRIDYINSSAGGDSPSR